MYCVRYKAATTTLHTLQPCKQMAAATILHTLHYSHALQRTNTENSPIPKIRNKYSQKRNCRPQSQFPQYNTKGYMSGIFVGVCKANNSQPMHTLQPYQANGCSRSTAYTSEQYSHVRLTTANQCGLAHIFFRCKIGIKATTTFLAFCKISAATS